MRSNKLKTRAFILIILAGVFWGTTGLFVNFLTPVGYSSLNLTAVRAFVAFVCMLGYILLFDRGALRISKRGLLLSIAMGVAFFATSALYLAAIQMTSVATSAVLLYMAPVYVAIYSAAFLGEKMTKIKVVSIGTVVLGGVLVSGVANGLSFNFLGITIAVLSGVIYAAYTVFSKLAMDSDNDPKSVTLYCFLVASIVALFFAGPKEIVMITAENPIHIVSLLGLGIVTSILPFFAYTVSLRTLPAGVASSMSIIEPLAASVFGLVLLKEEFDAFKIAGIVLILLAVTALGRQKD